MLKGQKFIFNRDILCSVYVFECVLLSHNMTTQISFQKSSDASKSHHENQNDLILNKYSYIFHFILNFLNKLNIYFVKYLIKFNSIAIKISKFELNFESSENKQNIF